MTTTDATAPIADDRPDAAEVAAAGRAHRLLRWCLAFVIIGIGIGGAWDRGWHVTEPFDDFFSPPHLFIYANMGLAIVMFGRIILRPELRSQFGEGFRVPLWPFPVPGPLAILGGGLLGNSLAGALDAVWHNRYGLDETNWSTPHFMLGMALMTTFLGYVSCRMALRGLRPPASYTPYALGFFAIAFSQTPMLGSIGSNASREVVEAISRIPVLAADPDASRVFDIYQHWNLNRTHWLFAPLLALWMGAVLTFVRLLDQRARVLLAVATVATFLSLSGENGTARALEVARESGSARPIPVILVALVLVGCRRLGWSDRRAWLASGVALGLVTYTWWGSRGPTPGLALAAACASPAVVLAGHWLGQRAHDIALRPTRRAVLPTVIGIVVVMPALTGIVDFWLRAHTPTS